MARRTVLVDDLDGGEATQTVTFTVGGVRYEIDLTDENAARFQLAIAPYMGAGRTVRVGTSGPSVADSRVEPRVVRKWATEQGIAIGDRGRIPLQLVDRYLESDNGGAVTAG